MASYIRPMSARPPLSRSNSTKRRVKRARSSTTKTKPAFPSSSTRLKSSLIYNSDESISQSGSDEVFASTLPNKLVYESADAEAWAEFENTVKNIDNVRAKYFVKPPKPDFVSSDTFRDVMMDMYGNTEYGNSKGYTLLKTKLNNIARTSWLATRMFNAAIARGKLEREREEQGLIPEITDEDVQEAHDKVIQDGAHRGWRVMKRQVNDQEMEHKTSVSNMNWTILHHAVKQMANTERTRQDLYERYGILPTKLPDGRIVCENLMLSERARAQLYDDENEIQAKTKKHANKRPSSYHPPPVYQRPHSQLSNRHTGRDQFKTGKSHNTCVSVVRKIRPKTANY